MGTRCRLRMLGIEQASIKNGDIDVESCSGVSAWQGTLPVGDQAGHCGGGDSRKPEITFGGGIAFRRAHVQTLAENFGPILQSFNDQWGNIRGRSSRQGFFDKLEYPLIGISESIGKLR